MDSEDLRKELAVRRIWEGVVATVVGGLILWSVTSSMSRSAPSTERMEIAVAPSLQPPPAPNGLAVATSTTREDPPPQAGASLLPLASLSGPAVAMPGPAVAVPGPAVAMPPAKRNVVPCSIPVGSILLYENFARYREGDATDWGPNTFVKMGLDRRNWLVSNVEGAHPVGRRIRLPNEFYLECRYSVYMPEVTRGILGWWKEPVAGKISFLNDRGVKYAIDWVIRYGKETTWRDPLGSALNAKQYYHLIELPGETAKEIGVMQPTGTLLINRDNNVIRVFMDGQVVVAGTIGQPGQWIGFEIDVVKAKNGTLFFTDFKIGL